MPGLHVAYWHGVWAPKGTPADIVAKLNVAIKAALAVPAVKERFLELGQEISSQDKLTPAALRRHQIEETEKWWPIVKAANIKAE